MTRNRHIILRLSKRIISHINYPLFHFQEIDYIMITGDFPSHEVWKQSREWNLAHSKMMSDLVSDVFPDKLILPSVGNHESFPCNRFVHTA